MIGACRSDVTMGEVPEIRMPPLAESSSASDSSADCFRLGARLFVGFRLMLGLLLIVGFLLVLDFLLMGDTPSVSLRS